MIVYDRFWETLKERGITQYSLVKNYHVSTGQLGRMRKNLYISSHTVEMFCKILHCRVEDIMEYIPEE